MVRSVEAPAGPPVAVATDAVEKGGRRAGLVLIAATASFLAAWLIFAVQPMATRMVLPRLGGSAAVWNTALVFFQVGLLAGYALTHLTTTRLTARAQIAVHLGLIAAATFLLPLEIGASWEPPDSSSPALWLIGVFTVTIGLPYLALSAISPLVQHWFSLSDHPRAPDPYFLYAASNAGSLLGLLTYPFFVEPLWSLHEQSRAWAAGYALFTLAIVAMIVLVRPDRAPREMAPTGAHRTEAGDDSTPRTRWRERGTWIGWALIPSSLMIGVTTHITTDVASIPLFWVVPLALYLLTYIVAFGARRLPQRGIDVSALALASVTTISLMESTEKKFSIFLHLATLVAIALAFHGRLSRSRPVSTRLTEFFLCTSLGGVLGGIFNALLAPVIFNRVLEYGLMLAIASVLLAREVDRETARRLRSFFPYLLLAALVLLSGHGRFVALAICALAGVAIAMRVRPIFAGAIVIAIVLGGFTADARQQIYADRSFYGAFELSEHDGMRTIRHGTTFHGGQLLDPERRDQPTAYYTRTGPIGRVFEALDGTPRLHEVGVVGLGAGVMAAYAEPERHLTFFEIDAKIQDIASDPKYFTFVHDARGPVDIRLGDGRIGLQRSRETFGLVVIDAFTSDSVPVHLLTREAIALYFSRLQSDGILAVHVSNRYIRLEPVVAAAAADLGLETAIMTNDEITPEQRREGKFASDWIMLARTKDALEPLYDVAEWRPVERSAGIAAWTDDHSDLISVLRGF